MTLVLRYAVRSDVGLLREGNEDSAYAGPRLLAVADGMGGHAAGEVASAVTIASMAELDSRQASGDMMDALSSAVANANARLQQMIIANPAVEGMGTTLTALLWSDGHAAVCHIGDSRGYLLRDGELYQITHDHTLVQSLVDEGRISVDDVSTHPQRSLLLRALDGRSVAEPDLSVHDSLPGDRYLLCSDGLSGVVSDETLRDTLAEIADPDAASLELIELALNGGGPDNITCIVADVVDTATTRLPVTATPVLAGAAANVGDPRWAVDGTDPRGLMAALEDHHEDPADPRTAGDLGAIPLTVVSENGATSQAVRARSGRRARTRRSKDSPDSSASRGRRRWPIVTASLVVLAAVIVGGGLIFWNVSQGQYYVAADSNGEVAIYRGISERIAGINWSSLYRQTGIRLDQVPSNYQQTVKTAYSAGSLAQVQKTVATIRAAVQMCQQQYAALQNWATAENAYRAEVALAKRQKKPTNAIPSPGPQPPAAGAMCPPSRAFGIPDSALTPAPSGQP
jgi:protein phosphatase